MLSDYTVYGETPVSEATAINASSTQNRYLITLTTGETFEISGEGYYIGLLASRGGEEILYNSTSGSYMGLRVFHELVISDHEASQAKTVSILIAVLAALAVIVYMAAKAMIRRSSPRN